MTPNSHIRDALTTLHTARVNADTLDQQWAALQDAFAAEHAALIEARQAAKETLALADRMVRDLGLAHFASTAERKPSPGLEITMSEVPEYDAEAALAWAKQTGMALLPERLDEKALVKIAKATPLPFVTMREHPSVRIATDLAKALAAPVTTEAPAEAGAVA